MGYAIMMIRLNRGPSMIILLYNPLSKNRKTKRTTKRLVDYFKKHKIVFRVKSLLKIKDLEAYIEEKPEAFGFVVLGGDGTVNTFINQTANLPFKHQLYLKRSGSGNDFLRSLTRQNPDKQYVMKMQYNGETRYFLNGAGMGMDGEISHRVNMVPKKKRSSYLRSALKSFFSYKPLTLHATIDGKKHIFKKAYLINMNNGAFIGGGMKLTPRAKLDENNFDVIVVHGLSRFMLVLVFASVYLGLHVKLKRYVFYTKAKSVHATMGASQIAQCDGECFENVQEITVTTTERSVRFKPFKKRAHLK